MELHQLEYFVAVAEEASFTRAASRVHVAQPGVSAQVRRLESELGQQLLDRSGRSVRLTEVGSAVLPFARAALDAVANARLAVDDLAGLVRGQVTVGMVSGCALPVLAELLAGFHDRHPGVAIALVEDNSDRLVERLRDGRLDLALIGWAEQTPADIDSVVLVDEELVAAVAPDHPLADAGAGPARSRSASYATCRWSACPAAPACGRRSTPPAPPPGSRRGSCSRPAPCPWWSSWPAGAWDWP